MSNLPHQHGVPRPRLAEPTVPKFNYLTLVWPLQLRQGAVTSNQHRRPTTQSQQGRLSALFWELADSTQLERRDPESVVQAWLGAVDGLEGRRRDPATTQTALAFLMRLESDPFYASPEQTRGGEKDSRGLVYSLALFLFERLTGHHPFVESLSPLECRIQQAKAKRIGTNNLCHLPKPLRTLLSKALSPFAEDRFEDVSQMRSEVENWLRGELPAPKLLGELRAATRPAVPSAVQSRPAVPVQAHRQKTAPPPLPTTQRRAFVSVDTLQGAVSVTTSAPPAISSVDSAESAPSPWLWPTISGGFALIAAVALFIAVQVGSRSTPAETPHAQLAAAAMPSASIRAPSVAAAAPDVAVAAHDVTVAALEDTRSIPEEPPAEVAALPAPMASSELQAVKVVRNCIPETKLRGGVNVGISLLFTDEGTVKRSFSGRLPFPGTQVRCLKDGFATITSDSDSEVGHMMSYDLYVSVTSERTRSRQAHH